VPLPYPPENNDIPVQTPPTGCDAPAPAARRVVAIHPECLPQTGAVRALV
jgi:hypothetical protein